MAEKMKTDDDITGRKYIELNTFIKMNGLAATGGQAKILIRSEKISLNGTLEVRNKKKLYDGDVVEYDGKKYVVKV
jgi:ribosome-associated protein